MGYMLHPDHWGNGYMSEGGTHCARLRLRRDGARPGGVVDPGREQRVLAPRRTGRLQAQGGVCAKSMARTRPAMKKIVYGITAEQWRTGQLPGSAQAVYPAGSHTGCAGCAGCGRVLLRQTGLYDQLSSTVIRPTHAGIHCGEWTPEGAHFQLSQFDEELPQKKTVAFYVTVGEDVDGLFRPLQGCRRDHRARADERAVGHEGVRHSRPERLSAALRQNRAEGEDSLRRIVEGERDD